MWHSAASPQTEILFALTTLSALFLSASHAVSRGLTLNTNFTWSHCIGDQYDQQTGQAGTGVSIPNNLAAYRGSCSPQDVRLSWIFNGQLKTVAVCTGQARARRREAAASRFIAVNDDIAEGCFA